MSVAGVTVNEEQHAPVSVIPESRDYFADIYGLVTGFLGFIATTFWLASLIDDFAPFSTTGGLLGYSWPAVIVGVALSAFLVYCEQYCHRMQFKADNGTLLSPTNGQNTLSKHSKICLEGSFWSDVLNVAGQATSYLLDLCAKLTKHALPAWGKLVLLMGTLGLAWKFASNAEYRTHKAALEKYEFEGAKEAATVKPVSSEKREKTAKADSDTLAAAAIKGFLGFIATYLLVASLIDDFFPTSVTTIGYSWPALVVGIVVAAVLVVCETKCRLLLDMYSQPENKKQDPNASKKEALSWGSTFLLGGATVAVALGTAGGYKSFMSDTSLKITQYFSVSNEVLFWIGAFSISLIASVSVYYLFKNVLLRSEREEKAVSESKPVGPEVAEVRSSSLSWVELQSSLGNNSPTLNQNPPPLLLDTVPPEEVEQTNTSDLGIQQRVTATTTANSNNGRSIFSDCCASLPFFGRKSTASSTSAFVPDTTAGAQIP